MKKLTIFTLLILLVVLTVFAVGCSSYKEEQLYLDEPDNSNLLFYLTEAATEQDLLDVGCTSFDLSGNPYKKTFLDKRYDFDTVFSTTTGLNRCYVTYSISKYPQEANRYHVTQISIYDPSIKVYGLTLESSLSDIRKVMKKLGFKETENQESDGYRVTMFRKDRFAFEFSTDGIRLFANYLSTDQIDKDDINYYYYLA